MLTKSYIQQSSYYAMAKPKPIDGIGTDRNECHNIELQSKHESNEKAVSFLDSIYF